MRTLHFARRHVTAQAALPPSRIARARTQSLRETAELLLPVRRLRANPRVIGRGMSHGSPERTRPRGQGPVKDWAAGLVGAYPYGGFNRHLVR
ncbi:hypothetical protein GCM10010430_58650 [Kitasatospora cystarginea]|uniref:Uncharacterized protein n=1 Tax=Kitasatospora cystarginea TaxID=58350 RepID=A0ABP5RLH3_9ACTN